MEGASDVIFVEESRKAPDAGAALIFKDGLRAKVGDRCGHWIDWKCELADSFSTAVSGGM
jgi:hypothetical protein